MHGVLVASLLGLALVFSGCSGGEAKASETPAPASVVIGEDGTASIMGLVHSDELQPLSGATAALEGIMQTVVSDEAGRFSFQNVPAGTYRLFVAKLGYESTAKSVTVEDGETKEVTITLTGIAIEEDFVDVIEFKMRMACGGGLIGVTFTGGCPSQVFGNHRVVADHNVTNKVETAVSELVWTQNSALSSKEMRLDMGKDESGGSLPSFKHRYGSTTGKSPVVVRADAEFDGLSDAEDGEYQIRHRIWVPFRSEEPPVVIIVLEQPLTIWSSMAYGSPLPEVYSALPDA